MELFEGIHYKRRDGQKAGPAVYHGGPYLSQAWVVPHADGHPATYDAAGNRIGQGHEDAEDLVAVWTDELPHDGTVAMDAMEATPEARVEAETIAAMSAVDARKIDALVAEANASRPIRVQILHAGAQLTNGDRDVEYGPPGVNMAAAGALKQVFRDHLRRDITLAELEAIDMVMTKLGRIATGTPKLDTYVDAATYFAIAGEIALTPATGA